MKHGTLRYLMNVCLGMLFGEEEGVVEPNQTNDTGGVRWHEYTQITRVYACHTQQIHYQTYNCQLIYILITKLQRYDMLLLPLYTDTLKQHAVGL